MLTLKAQKREILGRKVKKLRAEGILPAILYGPKIKNLPLAVREKEFEKIYKEAGESSLITLEIGKETFPVLIYQLQRDPLSGKVLHIDFYQPSLEKEIEAKVPLIFEGVPLAVKEFGGTLMKKLSEIEVKALPQNLPHEIKVDLSRLKTFDDYILVKDLPVNEGVQVLREEDEIIAQVLPPEKVEEELKKPIEEEVGEPEKIEEREEKEEEK